MIVTAYTSSEVERGGNFRRAGHEFTTSDLCGIDFDLSLSRGRSKNHRRKHKSCNNRRAAHEHAPFRGRAKTSLPDRALIIDTTWSPLTLVLVSIANRLS